MPCSDLSSMSSCPVFVCPEEVRYAGKLLLPHVEEFIKVVAQASRLNELHAWV